MTAFSIVLLTDFGMDDWYVGVMKGVIAGIAPDARTIDLMHKIKPGSMVHGAWILRNQFMHFPSGSVFCCVVDPGVGMERKAMAIRGIYKDREYRFVAPDNGLLHPTRQLLEQCEIRELTNTEWLYGGGSNTFHGRDIFAPAAARWLVDGDFEPCGPKLEKSVELHLPEPELFTGYPVHVRGQIMHVDCFGNAVLNVTHEWVDQYRLSRIGLYWHPAGAARVGVHRTFSEATYGEPLIYWGSNNALELGINGGDAAARFNLRIGDAVELEIEQDDDE